MALSFRDALYAQLQNMNEWPTATHHEVNRIVTSYGPIERAQLAHMEQTAIQQVKALGDPAAALAANGDWTSINPSNWAAILQLIITYLPQIIAILIPLFGGS
jgi:hypothetical protein